MRRRLTHIGIHYFNVRAKSTVGEELQDIVQDVFDKLLAV